MKAHFLICLAFAIACVTLARHLPSKCERHNMLSTLRNHHFNGFKDNKGGLFTIYKPSFLHVFIRSRASVPFEASSNEARSTVLNLEKLPTVLSSKVVAQNPDRSIPTFIELAEDDNAGTISLSASSSFTDIISELQTSMEEGSESSSGGESDPVSYHSTEADMDSSSNLEVLSNMASASASVSEEGANPYVKTDKVDMKDIQNTIAEPFQGSVGVDPLPSHPHFLQKMFLPFIVSSHMFEARFPGLGAWGRLKNAMRVKEGGDFNEAEGEGEVQVIEDRTWGDGVVQENADGSVTYHKTVDFPHGFFSVDVTSNDPIDPLPQASSTFEVEDRPSFLHSFLDAFSSFYNSLFGSILIGVGCGLSLSMISLMVFNFFFSSEENDGERTSFILSSTPSLSTPLLDEALNGKNEAVVREDKAT